MQTNAMHFDLLLLEMLDTVSGYIFDTSFNLKVFIQKLEQLET